MPEPAAYPETTDRAARPPAPCARRASTRPSPTCATAHLADARRSAAGARPPGHPGRAPAAGRRRDARRASTASSRQGPARHVPAGVGRARRGVVALLDRRRRLPGHADRAGRRRPHWIGEPPVGVPTSGDPRRGPARHRRRAARPRAPARAAAADRRHGRRRRPTTPCAAGRRLPDGTPDELHLPELAHDAGHRPGRPRPLATARCCWWPTRSTTTPPTSGSTRPGRTPSTGSTR